MEPRETKVNLGLLEDESLVFFVRQGDADAAQHLYQRYKEDAVRIAGNQDANWILALAINSCVVCGKYDRAVGPLRPYLLQTIRNTARSELRAQRRQQRDQVSLDASPYESARQRHGVLTVGTEWESRTSVIAESNANIRVIADLIDHWESSTVRTKQRRMWAQVLRRLCAGESAPEIAAALDVKTKSIHNILDKHIRPALRARLKE